MTIGKKIRIARILADKTQIQLGKEAGLTKDYISQLERGLSTNPTLDIMKRLSKALNVSAEELFFSEDDN